MRLADIDFAAPPADCAAALVADTGSNSLASARAYRFSVEQERAIRRMEATIPGDGPWDHSDPRWPEILACKNTIKELQSRHNFFEAVRSEVEALRREEEAALEEARDADAGDAPARAAKLHKEFLDSSQRFNEEMSAWASEIYSETCTEKELPPSPQASIAMHAACGATALLAARLKAANDALHRRIKKLEKKK